MIYRFVALLALAVTVPPAASAADWVPAASILNDFDAQHTCPRTCGSAPWRGQWRREPGSMFAGSCLCGSDRPGRDERRAPVRVREVDAGPIFSQSDAERKCPAACGRERDWDGNWRTVAPNRSTCDCVERAGGRPPPPRPHPPPPRKHEVDAGPIFSQSDAERKCPAACGRERDWDGNWRTVAPNRSTCDCVDRW